MTCDIFQRVMDDMRYISGAGHVVGCRTAWKLVAVQNTSVRNVALSSAVLLTNGNKWLYNQNMAPRSKNNILQEIWHVLSAKSIYNLNSFFFCTYDNTIWRSWRSWQKLELNIIIYNFNLPTIAKKLKCCILIKTYRDKNARTTEQQQWTLKNI
jgi:hypothetical protein